MRNLRFAHKQENHSRRTVFGKLQNFAFPLAHDEKVFAFSYTEHLSAEDGWNVYEPIAEFRKMGLVILFYPIYCLLLISINILFYFMLREPIQISNGESRK
jgi:hypothetical protein